MSASDSPLGLRRGAVALAEWDDRWTALFRAESERVARIVAEAGLPPLAIEHIGSTAIPGMCAKPILDLLAGYSPGFDADRYVATLVASGYEPRGGQGEPGHRLLALGAESARTHYVHLTAVGDATWKSSLAFRDRLRADPALASSYASLKRELAARHAADRAAYTAGKGEFIAQMIRNAPVPDGSGVSPPDRSAPAPAAVRRATPADAHALARLRYEFRSAIGEPDEEEAAFVLRCERWMAVRLEPGGGWWSWVAERDAEIVGAVWLHRIEKIPNPVDEPEAHGYITNFFVRERARGLGVGSALLGAALREAGAQGFDAIILWPTPRSRGLYERHGFVVPDDIMERRGSR